MYDFSDVIFKNKWNWSIVKEVRRVVIFRVFARGQRELSRVLEMIYTLILGLHLRFVRFYRVFVTLQMVLKRLLTKMESALLVWFSLNKYIQMVIIKIGQENLWWKLTTSCSNSFSL